MRKHVFLMAILLIAALAVPLSAQSVDTNKIFITPAKGGNQSARSYFNSKLPETVRLLGYEPAKKKKGSDFYLTVVLKKDKVVNMVAVTMYNTMTKKQVALDAMGYGVPTDLDKWNRHLITELMISANILSPGSIAGENAAKPTPDSVPKSKPEPEVMMSETKPEPEVMMRAYTPLSSTAGENAVGETAASGTANGGSETEPMPDSESKSKPEPAFGSLPLHWLYLGVRGGYSMRFYTEPGENFAFNFDTGYDLGHTFEAGIRAAGQVLSWLAIQVEGIFTMDTAVDKANTAEYKSMSLMFPLVVKVTFRPGQWLIAPFGGAYISVPLGKMKMSTKGELDWGWDDSMGLGWTAGLEAGRRLGPGILFLDIRYSADLADTTIDGGAAYRRTGATVSLGYDFGLFRKRK